MNETSFSIQRTASFRIRRDSNQEKENQPPAPASLSTITIKPIRRILGQQEEQYSRKGDCVDFKCISIYIPTARLHFPPPKVTASCWAVFSVD